MNSLSNSSGPGTVDPLEHHLYLTGIERFWVHQNEPNDCWAAALQTTRDYLRYHHVSQSAMMEATDKICPEVASQEMGAEAYQIAYAMAHVLYKYDGHLADPHLCNDTPCIAASLSSGHPLIMLGSGHAVVVAGIDYLSDNKAARPAVIVERLYILDPAGHGAVEKWSPTRFCDADAFISY